MIALAVILTGLVGRGSSVLAQEEGTVVIATPADGATVSGLITVTGVVDFPDFLKYEIFLSGGAGLIWAATTYAPVINGDLAMLDTRTFADGTYQMIIRKVNTDSNYTDFTGPTLIIDNGLTAPLPFPEVETSLLYPPPAGALMRLRNCSGNPLEFDYTSPDGFCSADDLWIHHKPQESPICTYVDILLIPCEYRGTAIGMGEKRGASYSFEAEGGKVYELSYPGGDRLFIGESLGYPRAETDTGGLDLNDPARYQAAPDANKAATPAAAPAPTSASSSTPAEAVSTTTTADSSDASDPLLPVSGEGTESRMPFMIVALAVIVFLIGGGIVAARKRGSTT
jgi:hypothetical protein